MMQVESYALLRHIEVHGPRSRPELAAGLARPVKDVTIRLSNLVALGYLAKDETVTPIAFALTRKSRVKLASPYEPKPPATKPRKARERVDTSVRSRATLHAAQAWSPPARRVFGAPTATPYRAQEYQPSTRPGAMVAVKLPSRFGDTLRYRDGRVTDMAGNPIE
jgi:hypothetical protein